MRLFFVILFLSLFSCQPVLALEAGAPENTYYEKAEVLKTEDFARYDEYLQQEVKGQNVKVKILGGKYEQKVNDIENVYQ